MRGKKAKRLRREAAKEWLESPKSGHPGPWRASIEGTIMYHPDHPLKIYRRKKKDGHRASHARSKSS